MWRGRCEEENLVKDLLRVGFKKGGLFNFGFVRRLRGNDGFIDRVRISGFEV